MNLRIFDNKVIYILIFYNFFFISVELFLRRYLSNSIIEVEKFVDIVWICCVDLLLVGLMVYFCFNNIMVFDEGYRLFFF